MFTDPETDLFKINIKEIIRYNLQDLNFGLRITKEGDLGASQLFQAKNCNLILRGKNHQNTNWSVYNF